MNKSLTLFFLIILSAGLTSLADADPVPLNNEYSIEVTAEQVDADSWVFTYSVTNNNQQIGPSMTGLNSFGMVLPESAVISNVSVPDPYFGSPGFWNYSIGNNWLGWWGEHPQSIYPVGSTAVFSFRADGVSLGDVSGSMTTYWNGYTPLFPHYSNQWGNYTDFSLTMLGPAPLHSQVSTLTDFADSYGSERGQSSAYDDLFDFNGDGDIDGVDLSTFCNCQNPTVELIVDPPLGDIPHTVHLEVRASGFCDDDVKYVWQLGDGIAHEGASVVLKTFQEKGTYDVSVTVLDSVSQAVAQTTVTVSPMPQQSVEIGSEGGTVSQGRMQVEIPGGLMGELTAPFTLTELPTMADAATIRRTEFPFHLIGSAYRIDTPLRTGIPFLVTLSFDMEDIPSGYSTQDLCVFERLLTFSESMGDDDPSRRIPQVRYLPIPVDVDENAGTVSFDAGIGGVFQLAVMENSVSLSASNLQPDKLQNQSSGMIILEDNFHVELIHVVPPPFTPDIYDQLVLDSIQTAYAAYKTYGFSVPEGTFRVFVDYLNDARGEVPPASPMKLILHYGLSSPEMIKRTVAHEFMHVIQYTNTNYVSAQKFFDKDTWFAEGTAEWGTDYVFDEINGDYSAPKGARFRIPLNALPYKDDREYETVVFWKWVETAYPGTLAATLTAQSTATQDVAAGPIFLVNSNKISFIDSLRLVLPEIDFLSFFTSALYLKDFEMDETASGDLWGGTKLGPPNQLPPGFLLDGQTYTLGDGLPGDGKDNPLTANFLVALNLTADAFVIKNSTGDDALKGRLNIKWDRDITAAYKAAVIAKKSGEVQAKALVDLSDDQPTAEVPFDSDTEVTVIIVDPKWELAPGTNPSQCQVWVEDDSCGSLPTPITEVDNVDDLISALKTAPAGSTVLMLPGVYSPPVTDVYDSREQQEITIPTNLVLDRDITLSGSGVEETTLSLTGASDGIYVCGDASIRNMTVSVPNAYTDLMYIAGVKKFKVCNVHFEDYYKWAYGILYQAWDSGNHDFLLADSSLLCFSCNDPLGITFSYYRWGDVGPQINLKIENTVVRGWGMGVEYSFDPEDGSVTVEADCEGFYDNSYGNVIEHKHINGEQYSIEHCP